MENRRHHHHHHHHHHDRRHDSILSADPLAAQITAQSAEQTESETVVVEKSAHIAVTQAETQSLVLAQSALEASVQALIAFGRTHDANIDLAELQAIIQRVRQAEREKVKIVKSTDVSVTQVESQFAVIAQTAVELLAQIVARL